MLTKIEEMREREKETGNERERERRRKKGEGHFVQGCRVVVDEHENWRNMVKKEKIERETVREKERGERKQVRTALTIKRRTGGKAYL